MEKLIRKRALAGLDSYGLNVAIHDASIIEMAAYAGYDFVRVDCEHMLFDNATLSEMIRTAKLLEIPLQLRVTNLAQASAFLDCGATALMIPHVRSRDIALEAVAALKYAPLGERGMTTSARVLRFGQQKLSEYARRANDEVDLIIQIEDRDGLHNIDEILSVDGVDFVATGRNDLAQALGVPGENTHPDVLEAENMVIRKAIEHKKIPTLLVKNRKRIQELRERGVHCFSIARDDLLLYSSLKSQLDQMQAVQE